jgi:hypothetical protein
MLPTSTLANGVLIPNSKADAKASIGPRGRFIASDSSAKVRGRASNLEGRHRSLEHTAVGIDPTKKTAPRCDPSSAEQSDRQGSSSAHQTRKSKACRVRPDQYCMAGNQHGERAWQNTDGVWKNGGAEGDLMRIVNH